MKFIKKQPFWIIGDVSGSTEAFIGTVCLFIPSCLNVCANCLDGLLFCWTRNNFYMISDEMYADCGPNTSGLQCGD